jgi:hypothetical protein
MRMRALILARKTLLHRRKEPDQRSGMPCGQERSVSPVSARVADDLEICMDTITTIRDLLKLNGSAQHVTVALTPSEIRLIAAAPDMHAEIVRLRALADSQQLRIARLVEASDCIPEYEAELARLRRVNAGLVEALKQIMSTHDDSNVDTPDADVAEYMADIARAALAPPSTRGEGRVMDHEWQPIETAPKDGTRILVALKNPIPRPGRDDLRPWDGLQLVVRHPGIADSDLGWNVAAPVGHGGFPDDWMAGWMPLPEPPK